jgi:hypothetical protein
MFDAMWNPDHMHRLRFLGWRFVAGFFTGIGSAIFTSMMTSGQPGLNLVGVLGYFAMMIFAFIIDFRWCVLRWRDCGYTARWLGIILFGMFGIIVIGAVGHAPILTCIGVLGWIVVTCILLFAPPVARGATETLVAAE